MDSSRKTAVGACTLGRAFGYEPNISHRLIEAVGSIDALFSLSEKDRDALLGPFSKFKGRLSDSEMAASEAELDRLSKHGFRFMTIEDPDYPAPLRECGDAPVGLYIRSASELRDIFDDAPCVSIVGTRDISPYGKEWCRRIVFALASAPVKPVIVSGMAYGVDITAHRAALEAGLRTIGVLPTGIDDMYPEAHRHDADTITFSPGCALITDFPSGTSPQAATFLRRNRIIAGMSCATILVESKKRGGGLITANTAFSYGRDVFALPGRIEDPRSEGCNDLIQKEVAQIISDVTMLPDAIGLGHFERRRKKELAAEVLDRYGMSLPEGEVRMLQDVAVYVKLNRGCVPEEIARDMNLSWSEVSGCIGRLCTDGFMEQDVVQRCSIVARNA